MTILILSNLGGAPFKDISRVKNANKTKFLTQCATCWPIFALNYIFVSSLHRSKPHNQIRGLSFSKYSKSSAKSKFSFGFPSLVCRGGHITIYLCNRTRQYSFQWYVNSQYSGRVVVPFLKTKGPFFLEKNGVPMYFLP